MNIPGVPNWRDELAEFREDLAAIRSILERLLELEEQR